MDSAFTIINGSFMFTVILIYSAIIEPAPHDDTYTQ